MRFDCCVLVVLFGACCVLLVVYIRWIVGRVVHVVRCVVACCLLCFAFCLLVVWCWFVIISLFVGVLRASCFHVFVFVVCCWLFDACRLCVVVRCVAFVIVCCLLFHVCWL